MENEEIHRTHAGKRPRRLQIPLARKLLYSITVVFIFFASVAMVEVMLRVFWTPPTPEMPTVGERKFVTWLSDLSVASPQSDPLYREDRRMIWSLIPGAKIVSVNRHHAAGGQEQPIRITINENGYRGPKLSPDPDDASFRILCLGDSNFFGYPLDDEHVFPYRLQQALSALKPGRQFEVINAGVPGYTIAQGKRWHHDHFQQRRFDVVLLSYLNNDAWPQPQSDSELFDQYGSPIFPIAKLLRHSQLVKFMDAKFSTQVTPENFQPRVPLDEFSQHYQTLIADLQKSNSRVMILDYRAYPQYESYSRKLENLARREKITYFAVAENIQAELRSRDRLNQYRHLVERVQRRWGNAMLHERPYLWYYAEYYPEHLNEIGTTWLADQIAPLVLSQMKLE